ncbi:MAG: hypothetical protein ACRDDE_11400 [Paraclostridium sp.]
MHFIKPNGHIITLKNIYGPVNNFMGSYLKEMTPDKFEAMGISLGSIRLSIVLENYNDLICDLEKALSIL